MSLDPSERDELRAWIALLAIDGLGNETLRGLLRAFGSAIAVVHAGEAALAQATQRPLAQAIAKLRLGLGGDVAPSTEAGDPVALANATLAWLEAAEAPGPRHAITLSDPDYPTALLEAPDPPSVLYAIGDLRLLRSPGVAVVGSRNATAQGIENARQFSASLSQSGLTVISGLALGIDAAAHEGGLTGPGRTIAVVGTGLDRVYPARHRDLAHRIAEQGLVVSEFPLGTPPLPGNFPKRNRIIAGLARGTLVVEAAVGSGSLITARLATDAGRDVFAIPGSIHAPQSRGCHWLIKQGAKLVDQAQDILDELRLQWPNAIPSDASAMAQPSGATASTAEPTGPWSKGSPDMQAVLTALGHDCLGLDALGARCGLDAARLSAVLLELELSGQVARLPGAVFQALYRA